MEISVKSLWMGASVVITVALITLGLMQYGKAKQLAALVSEDMGSLASEIADNEILRYDGLSVSGSDVRSFARRVFSKDSGTGISITVNSGGKSKSYYDYGDTEGMTDYESAAYVEPTGRFVGKVIKNGNGVITGIIFTGE